MEKVVKFTIILPEDMLVCSVNKQYELRRGKGGKIMGFYLNPEVKKMMDFIRGSLSVQVPSNTIDSSWGALHVDYVILMKQSFWKRDLDNTIKHTQDAIFQYFNINDTYITEMNAKKILNKSSNSESILCQIKSVGCSSQNWDIDSMRTIMDSTN